MTEILQEQRTLDQAVLGGMATFPNGCNFRLIIDRGEPYLEYGCYGVHINLCQGDERLLYNWFARHEAERVRLPIQPETQAQLMARKPCGVCGAPLFLLKKEEDRCSTTQS